MATTPIYELPYQGTSDPPNGPLLGEQLALAVEAEIQRIDQTLGVISGMEATSEVSPQSISASTITGIRWQAASASTGGYSHPNAFEFTVPTAGVYVATVQGTVNNGQTGRAYAEVIMDSRRFRTPFGGFSESGFGSAGTRRLAAGAVIKAEIYCATATTLGVSTLAIYRIGS